MEHLLRCIKEPRMNTFVRKQVAIFWLSFILTVAWGTAAEEEYQPPAVLFISNGTNILRLQHGNTRVESVVSQDVYRAVGVTVDAHAALLFWSDVGPGHEGIYRAKVDGSNSLRIITDVERVNGLSVDWLSELLYWTDELRGTVEVSDYNGNQRKILLDSKLQQPRGILTDPVHGYLYWGDQGTQTIERARLDGSERRVLVKSGLIWPNQLAISYQHGRVYWVDAHNESVESSDFDGQDRRQEVSFLNTPYAAPLFGLAIVNNTVFVSTWYDGGVYSTQLNPDLGQNPGLDLWQDEGGDARVIRTEVDYLTDREMFSMAAMAPGIQPPGDQLCGPPGLGGCSDLCLLTGAATYRCACSTYGTRVLASDHATCVEPDEILLYADKDKGHIGMLPLGGASITEHHILASSDMPVAVGYDPVTRNVYWSDVKDRTIYRIGLESKKKTIFLNASDGLGTVDGLYVDWQQRRLYFANMGNSSPKLDGAVFTWHRIEFIGLDGQERSTIVTDVQKPRALVLDMYNGYLYFSDWGEEPRIVRTDLDGSNLVIIVNHTHLSNPNGLALHGNHLYIVDSNYNHRINKPCLAQFNMDDNTWQEVEGATVYIPFGLAAQQDAVFYTDWLSTESSTGGVFMYNTTTGSTSILVSNMGNPTGLHYTKVKVMDSELDVHRCSGSDCSDICVPTPKQATTPFRCLCPDLRGTSLQQDKKLCAVPTNFLLMTDLNTIKMLSLDGTGDSHVYTLHHGPPGANYVALAYNPRTQKIYWSDLNRKAILEGDLASRITPHVFYQTDIAIDGLAIDPQGNHLYWTGYNSLSGVIAMMSLTGHKATYTELLTGLDMPRAIALDLTNNYLYWTEYGRGSGQPRLARAYLDGTNNETVTKDDLRWPNAIEITDGKIYLADGSHRRIDVMDLDGSNRHELPFLTGTMDHVFGLAVYDSALYFTDWYSNSTRVANLVTGHIDTLAGHLYRPTALVVHHPTDLTEWNSCTENLCSDICVPIPGGFHCTCPVGFELAQDGTTCIKAARSWELTDDFRCHNDCHDNAYCARLIPTILFQCVCVEGYHGDAVNRCQPCPVNTYKSSVSNDTCQPCPKMADTQGMMGSVTCQCQQPSALFTDGECLLIQTIKEKNISMEVPAADDYYEDYGNTSMPIYSEEEDTTTSIDVEMPVFQNCPSGEVVRLVLPRSESYAILNLHLYAHDCLGQNIPIQGSHDIPPGAMFEWQGLGEEGYQYVRYLATDQWGQQQWCEFIVLVVDEELPHFEKCPSDIHSSTARYTTRVYWDEPVVNDNVGLGQLVAPPKASGSHFEIGSWPMSYQAFDKQGNVAWCNFTVKVTRIRITCDRSHVTEPNNGGVVCGESQEGYLCHTFCDKRGYFLNPMPKYHSAQCGADGTWLQPFPQDYVTRACLKQSSHRRVERRLQFWFTGPCEPGNPALQGEIVTAIISLMKQGGLCRHSDEQTCNPEAFKVYCGEPSGGGGRRRRSEEEEETFRVQLTLQAQASLKKNLSSVETIVNDTATRVSSKFKDGVMFEVRGATYRSRQHSVQVEPLELRCQTGTIDYISNCLLCPVGSYSDLLEEMCSDCPVGTYQDEEGAPECESCPDGMTSPAASYNISQCFIPPHYLHRSLSTKDATILGIILAIVLLLGFLLAVVCYHRYRYHGHRSLCEEFSSPGHRSGLENPYVIEVKAAGDNVYATETLDEQKDLTSDYDNDKDAESSSVVSTAESAANIVPQTKSKNKLKDFMNKRKKPAKSSRRSKEEICLEVQTFMFDADGKSTSSQGHKIQNVHEHEYGD